MTSKRISTGIAVGIASMVVTTTGCYTSQSISITDHRSLAPVGEITWNPKALHYSDATFGGIQLAYERYHARETEPVPAINSIQFDDAIVTGGQAVKMTMDADIVRLAYRQRIKIRRHVELDAVLGAGYSRISFDALGLTTQQYSSIDERHVGASGSFTARAVNLFTYYGAEAKFSIDTSMSSFGWQAALLARPNSTMTYKLGAFARSFEVGREPNSAFSTITRGIAQPAGIFGSIGVEF